MLKQGLSVVMQAISSVNVLADEVFSYFNINVLFLGLLAIYCSYRFLLRPFLGGELGSDKAKKKKGDE